MKMNQKGFGLVEGLLAAAAVLLVGFGGYYVFSQNNDENTAVEESENVSNDSAVAPAATDVETETTDTLPQAVEATEGVPEATASPSSNSTDLFTAGTRNVNNDVILDFIIDEGFSQYWAEIGQTPDDLSLQTPARTDGLAFAFENYGGFSIAIDTTDLPEGDNIYFYRIAAIKDGVTEYTGVSSFNYK